MVTWKNAVSVTISRFATSVFTRQQLLRHLPSMITATKTVGKTPANTMDYTVQMLSKVDGVLKMHGRGRYEYDKDRMCVFMITATRRMSAGERRVCGILSDMDIAFEQERRVMGLRYRGPLRFDFYFTWYGKRVAIETDGLQHFELVKYFGGLESFLMTLVRDLHKNAFCASRGIYLLRIPYTHLSQAERIIRTFLRDVERTDQPFSRIITPDTIYSP